MHWTIGWILLIVMLLLALLLGLATAIYEVRRAKSNDTKTTADG